MMKKMFHPSRKNVAKLTFGLAIGALLWGAPTPVHATETDAPNNVYAEDNRPSFPAFNAIEGKQNFFSVENEEGRVFIGGVDTLELVAGQTYTATIAYCNDGLPKGVPNAVYAHGSKVRVDLPSLVDGEQTITAILSAVDTQPTEVSCALTVTSEVPLSLEFVPSSARIHNADKTNNSPVSVSDLFGSGADFGTNSMTGIVLYGEEHSGTIEFSFTASLASQENLQEDAEPSSTPAVIDLTQDTASAEEVEVPFYLYLLLLAAVLLLAVAIGYGLYYSIGRKNRHYRR